MEYGDVYVFGYNGLEQLLQETDVRILKTPMKWRYSLQKGRKWASTFSLQSRVKERTLECHRPPNSGATFRGESVDNQGHGSEGYYGAEDNCSSNLLYKHNVRERLGLQMNWNATLSSSFGFVMGSLNGELGKFVDLSSDPMAVCPSATRKLYLHEDTLFFINDSGDCFVRGCTDGATTELNVKVSVECAPVPTAVFPNGERQASGMRRINKMEGERSESERKEFPKTVEGYSQELHVGDAPHGNKTEADSIVGFTNLSAGDSHVLATIGPDNRPGRITRHVDGAYIFHPFCQPVQVQELSCGKEHALLLTAQGMVYSYGMGSRGQLGHGEIGREDEPKLLEAIACVPMATVSAGGWHSTCISTIGDLYIWGWNESGQLGLPHDTDSFKAQEGDRQETADQVLFQMVPAILDLPGGVNISKVSCGTRHTAAVTYDKRLYTWGWGKYGQLGHGDVRSRCAPELVNFFLQNRLGVLDVICGDWSTAAYTSSSPKTMPR